MAEEGYGHGKDLECEHAHAESRQQPWTEQEVSDEGWQLDPAGLDHGMRLAALLGVGIARLAPVVQDEAQRQRQRLRPLSTRESE